MNDERVSSLLAAYAGVSLAAWDNLRLVLSECAHHEWQAQGFEIEYATDTGMCLHYWVQIGEIWLDCGRTNAYSVSIARATHTALSRVKATKTLECAILSPEQLGLLCMQNAHFDHC